MQGNNVPQGNAYYVKVKFHPTKENARYRIHYIGAVNSSLAENTMKHVNFNLYENAPIDAAFGFLTQYKYHSPLSQTTVTMGLSEYGYYLTNASNEVTGKSIHYQLNDMVSGGWNCPAGNFSALSGNLRKMTGWKSQDVDFSEFVDLDTADGIAQTEITMTFFAHANSNIPALQSAYAYYAIECLGGGIPKAYSFELSAKEVCGDPNTKITFTKPKVVDILKEGGYRVPLVDPLNGRISVTKKTPTGYVPWPAIVNGASVPFYPATNYSDVPGLFSFTLNDSDNTAAFFDYNVKLETLRGVFEKPIRIIKSFEADNSANACQSGGAIPAGIDKVVTLCPSSSPVTFPTLIFNPADLACPAPEKYEWYINDVKVSNNASGASYQVVASDITTSVSKIIRRSYFKSLYCGTTTQDSEAYIIYSLGDYKYNYTVASGNDLCASNVFTTEISGFKFIKPNAIPSTVFNDLPNQNRKITIQLYDPATNTNLGAPKEININNSNGLPSTFPSINDTNFPLTFTNLNPGTGNPYFIPNPTTNEFKIGLRITSELYGCTATIENPNFFKMTIISSALAGAIARDGNAGCSDIGINSNDNGKSYNDFYDWQYLDGNNNWTNIIGGPHTPSFPNASAFFATGYTLPVKVRRVSFGTGTCSAPSPTTAVVINGIVPIVPVFNLPSQLCMGGTAFTLPTTSDNGIIGTWLPAVVDNTQTKTYVFTPAANQCAVNFTKVITVLPTTPPVFSFPAKYCTTPPILPLISSNGIAGTWQPSIVTADGNYVFTPNNTSCVNAVTVLIAKLPGIQPTFDNLQTTYCTGSTLVLPTQSGNGVVGTWFPATINTSSVANINATFSANVNGSCFKYSTVFRILQNSTDPLFTFSTSLCKGNTAPVLPTTSANGITGSWNPSVVSNLVTQSYTFTPNVGQCAVAKTLTINVVDGCGINLTWVARSCENANQVGPRVEFFADLEGGDCIKVCANSLLEYKLSGHLALIQSTFWQITGGTIQSQGSTFCNVLWGNNPVCALQGTITLLDGSALIINKCIETIAIPTPDFGVYPDLNSKPIIGCVDTPINFENTTNAGGGNGTLYYIWDFGDGTYSNEFEPMHSYHENGTYKVSLTVFNGCGCINEIVKEVTIEKREIPLTCNSLACEGDISHYSIPKEFGECNSLIWTVTGGTIVFQSENNTSVDVLWNNIDAEGFGYVNIDSRGCFCSVGNTIKVPVVQNKGTITGPDHFCPDTQFIYSLPKWPSTEFNWSLVNDNTEGVLFYTNQRNEIVFQPSKGGTVELKCSYYNTLLHCGGIAYKTLQIKSPLHLEGDLIVCKGVAANFNVFDENQTLTACTWKITGPNGYNQTGSASAFTKTFTTSGLYVFQFTGSNGCSTEPITITVNNSPAAPAAITGKQIDVCPGIQETYSCAPLSGCTIHWSVENGTILGNNVGGSVVVLFDPAATAPYKLFTWYESEFCLSATKKETIVTPKNPTFAITTASPTVYESCSGTYSIPNIGADSYSWSIDPPSAGSFVTAQNSNSITVQWNSGVISPMVKVLAKICGRNLPVQTYTVNVLAAPTISFENATNSACNNAAANFSIALNSNATITNVVWNFGDGSPEESGGISKSHSFNNPISSATTYTVSVTATIDNNGCPATVNATHAVTISPSPIIDISPKYVSKCIGIPTSTNLQVNLQEGFASTSNIKWYRGNFPNGELVLGATSATYDVSIPNINGFYYAVVTNGLGCSSHTQEVYCKVDCTTIPTNEDPDEPSEPATGNGSSCFGAPEVLVNITTECGGISATLTNGNLSIETNWSIIGIPVNNYSTIQSSNDIFHITNLAPGAYELMVQVGYDYNGETCTRFKRLPFIIPYKADLKYTVSWNANLNKYSVTLLDHSVRSPLANITTHQFYVDGSWVSGGNIGTDGIFSLLANLAPGLHTAKIRISGGAGTLVCESETISIDLPQPPNADFSYATSICQDSSVELIALSQQSDYTYLWEFLDDSSNTQPNCFKSFVGAAQQPISLTVTNKYGCSSTVGHAVNIIDVKLKGLATATPSIACAGSPVTVTFVPGQTPLQATPYRYEWYKNNVTPNPIAIKTNDPNLTVTAPGLYFAYVSTLEGCKIYDNDGVSVSIVPTPVAPVLTGTARICEGSLAKVNVPAGGNALYDWYIDGALDSAYQNATSIEVPFSVGQHVVGVKTKVLAAAGVYCESAMGTFVVTVDAMVAMPEVNIVVNSCVPYSVTLTVSNVQQGVVYKWSNGQQGTSISMAHDGPIGVTATLNNCETQWETDLPVNLEPLLWIFPQGCYAFCKEQKYQASMIGPYGEFGEWAWKSGEEVLNGGSGEMTPFNDFTNGGDYSMYLQNAAGCDATQGTMSFEQIPCANCGFRIDHVEVKYYPKGDNCSFVVTFNVISEYDFVVWAQLSANDGQGYFSTSTIAAAPGESTHSVYFYPSNGYLGGSTIAVTVDGFVRNETCFSVFEMNVPECSENSPKYSDSITLNGGSNSLVLAPNPTKATTVVYYAFENKENAKTIEVVDLLGRVLISIPLPKVIKGEQTLDLGQFAAGEYVVFVKENNRIIGQQKLILSK